MKRKIAEMLAMGAMTVFGLFGLLTGTASAECVRPIPSEPTCVNPDSLPPDDSYCVGWIVNPWVVYCVWVEGTQVCYGSMDYEPPYVHRWCYGV